MQVQNTLFSRPLSYGKEVEVDAICDGETTVIPGIMEHIERAGVPQEILLQYIISTNAYSRPNCNTGRLYKRLANG